MSHMIHYILIAEYAGAPQEELSCEASSAIERHRYFVFDYMDESPVDKNGEYLKTVSFSQAPQAFLKILADLRENMLASYRAQLESLADSIGMNFPGTNSDGTAMTGAELFRQIYAGMRQIEKGEKSAFLAENIRWHLQKFISLVCGEYTFESGFYDATKGYNAIIPTEQDITELASDLADDVDLYLVPLDLHY